MSQVLITVTGKFVTPTGAAAAGRIAFVPSVNGATDPGLLNIMAANAVGATLDNTGAFSVALIPTDDPDRNPIGWTYRVIVHITGAPTRVFEIPLSIDTAGGTIDLSEIIPIPQAFGDVHIEQGPQGAVGPQGVPGPPNPMARVAQRGKLNLDVMASAPTIGAPTSSSSISGAPAVLWNDARINFSGGVLVGRDGNQDGFNGFNLDSIVQEEIGRIEIMLDGSKFELITAGIGASGKFRILINDQYLSLTPTAAGQTDVIFHYYLVNLGSRQQVKITVEFEGTGFLGFAYEPTGSMWKAVKREPRVLFVGDSLTQSTAATAQENSYAQWLSTRLGWLDPWCDGVGGSGYLAPGVGHNFAPRMTFNYQYAPDVIVIFGGVNDRPTNNAAYTPAALQAAATALYADIVAHALPGINSGAAPKVYVLGCWQPSGPATSDITAANAAIQAAVATQPTFTFIDTTGWISGTGHVGATTGTGNADFAIANDGLHPTDEGHKLAGWRAADQIIATFPAIGL